VYFKGQDLGKLNSGKMRSARRDMQLIFEDPYYSLDPHMRVGDSIAEPLLVHKLAGDEERKQRVADLLMMVQLDPDMAMRYPHEFSAGQKQRIEIARALIMRPSFVVCDNPTSQLDVSVQAQIIDLLMWFRGWLKLTYLFIAHDLAIVRNICDRVMVMYAGKILEIGNKDELYNNPLHPYTRSLLSAVLVPDPEIESQRKSIVLPGEMPSPLYPPPGCRFHPRCFNTMDICKQQEPELKHVSGEHFVACHRI
jgi:oligopeptide transport system ATP-binding protein